MAGYRETFGANVDYAYGRGVSDIGGRLERGMSGLAGAGKDLAGYAARARDARRGIKDLATTMKDLKNDIANATDPREIRRLTRAFEDARKSADGLSKKLKSMPFDMMEKGMGKVVKGLLSFNTSILSMAFGFLIDSIKRVYELQERWTRAIGAFNMKIGGMTSGLKGAQKAAVQWSSTIRGLTNGDIEEGIQMFGEFTMAMGRTVKAGDGFSKLGIQIARGFGVGGGAAGGMLKTFENIGMSAEESAEAMKVSIKAANAAGIPVNMLAEDLSKSITYMARFGKEGQKTLVQGAAWARKYDMTLEQLKATVEGFDMFDEAARSASKLNTAFGTMINSMDLMMEDDPAKRLDMIRQQMLAQGMTYDKLTPKQVRYFSETLKLSEEQTAALLDARNANESYSDFVAKAQAKEKKELSAKQMMEKQLRATAQTMYAFGMAFDRVTVAIAKAIRPLLEVLGLAKKGGKDFQSFGQVMQSITNTVVSFFESLAGNDKWMGFMQELGNDLKRAGAGLRDFVMDGRAADLVGDIAAGMKRFYITVRDLAIRAAPMFRPLIDVILFLSSHIEKLALAWAGLKVFNMAGGMSGLGKLGSIGGGMAGRVGMAGAAGAAGYAIGGKGAGIGAGAGNMIGGFFGPLGAAAGTVLGGLIGKGVEMLLTGPKGHNVLEEAQEGLRKTIEREAMTRQGYELQVESFTMRQKAEDTMRRGRNSMLLQLDKAAQSSKAKEVILSKEQAEMLKARSSELELFSKGTKGMLSHLSEGSRLTAGQLKDLKISAAEYDKTLAGLRDTSEQILRQQQGQLEVSSLGTQKMALELLVKNGEAQLAADKARMKTIGAFKPAEDSDFGQAAKYITAPGTNGQAFENAADAWLELEAANGKEFLKGRSKLSKKEQEQLDITMRIRKNELQNVESQKKLQVLQTDFLKQQSILQIRALEMGSGRFLEFSKSHPEYTSTSSAFEAYLQANRGDLEGLYSKAGYELLSQKPTFMAAGGVVTRPTKAIIGEAGPEAVIPLSKMRENLAGGGSDGGATVTTQMAVVELDGQRVGRALVRSVIRGRN